jgi:hypothetical protein
MEFEDAYRAFRRTETPCRQAGGVPPREWD